MKIKIDELEGAALDWVVAKCEGFIYVRTFPAWKNKHGARGPAQVMVSNKKEGCYAFAPSTNWSRGGTIIEREKISIDWPLGRCLATMGDWATTIGGPTALIAAMRCYVASKLGEEVDVPEELMEIMGDI